jgi:hypothetical protein
MDSPRLLKGGQDFVGLNAGSVESGVGRDAWSGNVFPLRNHFLARKKRNTGGVHSPATILEK